MTTEEFNALPLEARHFIQKNAGCLACGNTKQKLDRAYALYLNSKKMATYQLYGGGINYKLGEETGILYNIKVEDTPMQIREKMRIAKLVREKRPHSFSLYDEAAMDALVASLPAEEVVDLEDVFGDHAKAVANTLKSLEASFDPKKATYEELKDYAKQNGIIPSSEKKADYIAAIEAELL